jgi:hypothetical protein
LCEFLWTEPRPNFPSWLFEVLTKARKKLGQVRSSEKKGDSVDIQIPSVRPLCVKIGTTEEHCVKWRVTQNRTVTHYNFVLVAATYDDLGTGTRSELP